MKNRISTLFSRLFVLLLCLSFFSGGICPLRLAAYKDCRIAIGETNPLAFPDSVIGGLSTEVTSRTPLIEKNGDMLITMPAEVALLVNALVAVDELGEERLDETFTVIMAEYPFVTDVGNLEIRDWSKVTYRDMLALMLLCRSQDAASILAVQIGGRYSSYLEKMNYRAGVLNMRSTSFLSVNGLYSEDQCTTFSDITALLSAVSVNETIINILSQTTYSVSESSTRLQKSYDSLLPQTSVPGMVTAFCGESKEYGTVYACIDRRDFTVCTAVLFRDQQPQDLMLPVSELHNAISERYLVASAAEIAEVLVKDEKIRYYNLSRACYIQAVDYSPCVFLREVYDRAMADEAALKEMFSFDYQRGYIYSETLQPGSSFAVAELRYGKTPVCSAPLYVSDIEVETEIPVSEPKFSLRQIYEEYPMYVMIAGGAVALLILVVLVLIFGRRRYDPDDPDLSEEDLADSSAEEYGEETPSVSEEENSPELSSETEETSQSAETGENFAAVSEPTAEIEPESPVVSDSPIPAASPEEPSAEPAEIVPASDVPQTSEPVPQGKSRKKRKKKK